MLRLEGSLMMSPFCNIAMPCVRFFLCIVWLCCGRLLLASSSDIFQATDQWQQIRQGQKVPAGLHYRIDLQTGRKEAKLLEGQGDAGKQAVIAVPPDPAKTDQLNASQVRDRLSSLKLNRDVDHMELLIQHFANASVSQKLAILQDLDYYLHQVDNARDFIKLGGFERVILSGLRHQDNADLVEHLVILVGSAAQSNPYVQRFALDSDLMQLLLAMLPLHPTQIRSRIVFALSSLIRSPDTTGLSRFEALGGFEMLRQQLRLPHPEDDQAAAKLTVKILTLVADVMLTDQPYEVANLKAEEWCPVVLQQATGTDLDHVVRVGHCLYGFRKLCLDQYVSSVQLVQWMSTAQDALVRSQDEESDDEEMWWAETLREMHDVIQAMREARRLAEL